MESELDSFISRINSFTELDDKSKIDYLSYYFTNKDRAAVVTSTQIEKALSDLDMKAYSRTAAYLSEESKSKNGKYLKQKTGYRLERKTFDHIKKLIENEPKIIAVSKQLADLQLKVIDTQEAAFLNEAINCYKVGAYRASIVMVWALAIDHLQKYIFGNKLTEFNNAIKKDSNKKLQPIIQYDDFSEIREIKLIELMRSGGIISDDVKKILDEKLGIRNSAAHPSNIVVLDTKATEFISDLLVNILLKY
jgi:hypothetical protein